MPNRKPRASRRALKDKNSSGNAANILAGKVLDAAPSPIQTPWDSNPEKENHASLSQTRTSPKKSAKAAASKKQAKQKKTQPSSFEKELEEMQEKLQAMKLEKEKTLELLKEKNEILKTKEEDLAMKGREQDKLQMELKKLPKLKEFKPTVVEMEMEMEMDMDMDMVRSNQRRLGYCCMNNARLMELPIEILDNIYLRLPISCLFTLRCVSNTSKTIVDRPCFVTQHMRHLLSAQSTFASDQFMLLDYLFSYSYRRFAFTPLKYDGVNAALKRSEDCAIVSDIVSTKIDVSYSLSFVFYNLFFFQDHGYSRRQPYKKKERSPCFLVNPLKGEVLPLPTTDIQFPYSFYRSCKEWYGMGFDDITSTYKILRVSGDEDSTVCQLRAQIYVLGTGSWREIPSVPPRNLSNNHAFAHGDQHWLLYLPDHSSCNNRYVLSICSFDYKKEEFYSTIPLPEHMQSKYTPHYLVLLCLHLLNLKGSLAVVDTVSDDYIEVWVLKNYDTKEWRLDYKIEKATVRGELINVTCCEWEYGIFFTSQGMPESRRITIFVDFRCGSISHVNLFPPKRLLNTSILSYNGTLMSLKSYGKLVRPDPTTGSISV
ncbi:hypothetical protein C1H46_026953 [Malus baccata]|uniref:F-box domain-containing protein n=1 Tax=Malus baccata TaxID=106549 RepID=A0A540LM28_MALBA|nr:hypothetical protein C1H46_026953 [Malus baccata]